MHTDTEMQTHTHILNKITQKGAYDIYYAFIINFCVCGGVVTKYLSPLLSQCLVLYLERKSVIKLVYFSTSLSTRIPSYLFICVNFLNYINRSIKLKFLYILIPSLNTLIKPPIIYWYTSNMVLFCLNSTPQ